MSHLPARPASYIAGAILLLTAACASAQETQSKAASAGQFHALADFCGVPSPEMMALFKERQKAAAVQSGIAPGAFDAAYAWSYGKARAALAEYDEEEKAETCRPLKAMAGQD
ncbi:hypothetical protein [Achromobacter agilis]|uniref:Lipoprotein n=1 Tax=Achromobacter agilis TaxID=1353888 RepID=A0A446CI43_9BURK|nr:hypothetical protein [Achromobacter agilis]SSW67488.1 hypothetical protein AGI3411_03151 [Achromobacter agilis]